MNPALSQRRIGASVLGAAALLALVACSSTPSGGAKDADLALIHQVMERVRANYVEPVGADQLTKDSLKGMLTGLDPHSDYMDESEYQETLSDSHGEFSGIGAELTRDARHPTVPSPIPATPAAPPGIRPAD